MTLALQDSFIYLTCKPEASVVQDNWQRALGTRNSGERQWLSSQDNTLTLCHRDSMKQERITKFVIVGLGVSQEMSFATYSLKKFYGQVQNTEHHIPYSRLVFFF